jgi:hypothetical protein
MGNIIPGPPTLGPGAIRPDAKDSTLEFWWEEPPAQMPPATVNSYTLSCSSISFSQTVDSSIYYLKVSSLTNNIDYSFQIVATNENGSNGNPAYFRTVRPGFVPNPVISPTVTVISTSAVQVSWTGPTPDSSIPSTGWFVVESISSSPSDSVLRVNTYGYESSIIVSSLNTGSQYAFNVYAVNDPGYSLAISTIAVSPIIGAGDLYTYFNIVTVAGSNDYYYRIYNSQTGWGDLIDTGVDSAQYTYDGDNGGGSNYFFGSFYNSTTSNYAVPFFNTNGIALQTITWDGANDNYGIFPNSFSNDTFFSVNSNSETGLFDLQLYQPDTGLYQSSSIVGNYFTEGPAVYPIPLQNSVVILTGSASNTILNYIWSVTENTPLFLYEGNPYLVSEPIPVNSNTGMFNVAGINSTEYFDTVNYITEPSTYMTYTLPQSTYTNYWYPTTGPYGNNNQNSFAVTLYNSNTTLYDAYIWNNFSNSSNFSNPVILSNLGAANNIFGFVSWTFINYIATYATNAFLIYDFDSNTYANNQTGIGTTYSVFDNGSTCSTVFTSTNLALGSNFTINCNATGVLQLDSNNNVGIALCSQVFEQSTIILSTATGYLDSLSTFNNLLAGYTNFISLNLPQADGSYSNFVTIQTDNGAITAFSTNTGINTETYCGSTGMVLYSNGFCDVLFNGIITSNIPLIDSNYSALPDFAVGIVYGSYYDGVNFLVYTARPDGIITSTTTTSFPFNPNSIEVTPSTFLAYMDEPFKVMVQTLDDSQYFNEVSGVNCNAYFWNDRIQSDSVGIQVFDPDVNIYTFVVFNYATQSFNQYTEENTLITMTTTSPYYWAFN